MPIFAYSCLKCDHQFDKLVKDSEKIVECPYCGSLKVHKLISPITFHLKGDGWYKKTEG